jgi:uncharacterized protein YjbJ (UPF0337 family)
VRYRTDRIQFCVYDFSQAMGYNIPRLSYGYLVMATNKNQETLMNKDQADGLVEEVKGKVKEAAGVILDDKEMEIEGNVQKNVGKVQSGFGDLKEDIKKDIDSI